jgi:hypothetical protein
MPVLAAHPIKVVATTAAASEYRIVSSRFGEGNREPLQSSTRLPIAPERGRSLDVPKYRAGKVFREMASGANTVRAHLFTTG